MIQVWRPLHRRSSHLLRRPPPLLNHRRQPRVHLMLFHRAQRRRSQAWHHLHQHPRRQQHLLPLGILVLMISGRISRHCHGPLLAAQLLVTMLCCGRDRSLMFCKYQTLSFDLEATLTCRSVASNADHCLQHFPPHRLCHPSH